MVKKSRGQRLHHGKIRAVSQIKTKYVQKQSTFESEYTSQKKQFVIKWIEHTLKGLFIYPTTIKKILKHVEKTKVYNYGGLYVSLR